MNIAFDRFELMPALDMAQNTVKDKSPTPILTCLLLEATEDGDIYLRANDGIVGLETKIDGEINEPGLFAVPAKRLHAIASTLSPNEPVLLQSAKGNRVVIRSGNGRYQLAGFPADEFPVSLRSSDQTDDDKQITINGSQFRSAVDQVIFASATEPDRNLDSLCFDFKNDNFQVIASDSILMSKASFVPEEIGHIDERIIVLPAIAAKHARRIFSDSYELTVWQRESAVVIADNKHILTSRLVAGQYFNYTPYFQEVEGHNKAIVNRKELIMLLKRMSVLAFLQKANVATLTFLPVSDENQQAVLKVETEVSEQGDADDIMEIESATAKLEVNINCDLFLKLLQSMKTKQIEIQYTAFDQFLRLQAILEDEKESEHVSIIPPIKR